jgi:hypothetical protein
MVYCECDNRQWTLILLFSTVKDETFVIIYIWCIAYQPKIYGSISMILFMNMTKSHVKIRLNNKHNQLYLRLELMACIVLEILLMSKFCNTTNNWCWYYIMIFSCFLIFTMSNTKLIYLEYGVENYVKRIFFFFIK